MSIEFSDQNGSPTTQFLQRIATEHPDLYEAHWDELLDPQVQTHLTAEMDEIDSTRPPKRLDSFS